MTMNQRSAKAQADLSATATDETGPAPEVLDDAEQDPAGGIRLSGRNRVCARAQVLAGLVLSSGIVIALSTMDTSVSAPHA